MAKPRYTHLVEMAYDPDLDLEQRGAVVDQVTRVNPYDPKIPARLPGLRALS